MRRLEIVASSLVIALTLSGCASFRNREWGSCAVAGGIIGAAAGGITGGVVANNEGGSDAARGGAIAGGVVGGAALGALLGHLICDPVPEEPKPAPPPPVGTKIADLPGTNFDFNKATIKPEGKVKLDEAAVTMAKNPDIRVSVEGHTDSIGSDAYNQKLSERRADSVVSYLVSKGIAASRLSAKGYGESKPVADNKTEEGRAKNRRVELIVR
jgi:outer membrane protein OmpA-like peptidoglycan-associated protein